MGEDSMSRRKPRTHRISRELNRNPPHVTIDDVCVAARSRRRRRALSSPSRTVAASGHGDENGRERSPSLHSPPLSQPRPHTPASAGPASGEGVTAFYCARPPPAPLWLCPWPPEPLDKISVKTSEERWCSPLEALPSPLDAPLSPLDAPLSPLDAPLSPPTPLPTRALTSSPRSVAVQTQYAPTARTADTEKKYCNAITAYDKSGEWATRLLDGHVRLAMRALRQLRRADRLHRALLRRP